MDDPNFDITPALNGMINFNESAFIVNKYINELTGDLEEGAVLVDIQFLKTIQRTFTELNDFLKRVTETACQFLDNPDNMEVMDKVIQASKEIPDIQNL